VWNNFSIELMKIIGYQKIFLIAAIPSLIGASLIYHYVSEKSDGSKNIYRSLRVKDMDSNLALYLVLSAIFSLGAFSYSFLLVFANRAGFSNYEIPLLYLLFTVTASAFSLPLGGFPIV